MSSKSSFWLYTFFVFFSVSFFGGYSIYTSPESGDFSSTVSEQAIQNINKANQKVAVMLPRQDDMTCTCHIAGVPVQQLSFERPEDCGADRNYLQDDIEAFSKVDTKGYFSKPRDYAKSAEILPRKCALFIMRKFWKDRALSPEEKRQADIEYNRTASENDKREVKNLSDYSQDPGLYSKCDNQSSGTPERYGHKACVTEDYVNIVYNTLIDVSDCLSVPAKFIAPKLSNESGLHVNAFGRVNDGGIGQFTDQALRDVAQNYDEFKQKIMKSEKESCKRLRSFPGAIPSSSSEILTEDANRCHAISTPPNPLRSLVYYGIFYHSTNRNALYAFNKSADSKDPNFKSIEELMNKAGVGDFDLDKVKQMLFVMAYNSGPARPAIVMREWLKYRIENRAKYPLTKEDFNMNYWPDRAQFRSKVGEERLAALNKKGKPLTLAEYMFVYKDSVYIAAVKAQARLLEKGLGEGTCTEPKFLEL